MKQDVPALTPFVFGLHFLDWNYRPESRLGAGGMAELRAHEALAGTDWDGILARTAKTPLTPANQANVRQDEGEVMFGTSAYHRESKGIKRRLVCGKQWEVDGL